MPSLKDIKKRIGSVKNTSQITKAMKMVSAAKLRRAQDAVVAARPYADKLNYVLSSLALREDHEAHPLLQERGKKKALVLLLTADRGLCGGFNANISKTAEKFIKERTDGFEEYELMIVGRKGADYLRHRNVPIGKVHAGITASITYHTAALIGSEVVEGYLADQYDAVYLIYNAFQSAITQVPTIRRLLPIEPAQVDEREHIAQYIYEPGKTEVLSQILPKQVEVQIFRGLLESVASEHGARMSAMDSASKNAAEMINKLTLQYNRARQAAITKELMEIISGAEAIK
ncbi:ATP synthase F1 subunit gamma [Geothermobacter hydrogeniphilus]|uniref:ATP synthase gamma chain n=1 Tax=Geothermobacter hydrogeniphilus TaxID=1969733 RepID=A0A2K2HAS0_9BACT|nr:ATP synthase F1 subunit gamma [Geothermobacter hydrogeniphilus]PNU20404.1 ATP synthase F1 subunit gamma [Geothermobacter hydrogeniphilus]